jgi:E3 ubiquitin-protein ligase AIP2
MATLQEFESSGRPVDNNTIETASNLLGELMSNFDDMIPEVKISCYFYKLIGMALVL